jgi:dihydroorotate dehydrogenase
VPDWFYRTISQPLLFRLPAPRARDFAVGFMGGLARLPLGRAAIDFLGHMRPDPRLRRRLVDIDFPASVGLGPGLDTRATALPAWSRFGFGFLEIGPVVAKEPTDAAHVERDIRRECLCYSETAGVLGLDVAKLRVAEAARLGTPIMVRLGCARQASWLDASEECRRLIHELSANAQLFSLATLRRSMTVGCSIDEWKTHLGVVLNAAQSASPARPLMVCVPADGEDSLVDPLVEAALTLGADGLLVDGAVRSDRSGVLVGLPAREAALLKVAHLRKLCGREPLVIAAGGIHEPGAALELRSAGADLVEIDSGLVFSGPGLTQRINNAFLFADLGRNVDLADSTSTASAGPVTEMTWFWTALLGAGMLIGSLLTLLIAATRVILPYDESFVGMSREELHAINPRLLAFMTHDRVTLAGTMVAIGVMYLGLSLYGVRSGLHWARHAVFISAFTGFGSFFLFLGFGYLDPLHAFVTASLLQLLLLGVHSRLGPYTPRVPPMLYGARSWRLALWGQLLLIVHGCLLLAAGVTISTIGATSVFVPEDLEFMQTTAEALRSANPRLVPLVAHDRATFGGMLLSSGWIFLLPAMWGFQNGAAWLWWTLFISGVSAYVAAIGVHLGVGYTDWGHLLPAFGGLGLLMLGLALSYSFLCRGAPVLRQK